MESLGTNSNKTRFFAAPLLKVENFSWFNTESSFGQKWFSPDIPWQNSFQRKVPGPPKFPKLPKFPEEKAPRGSSKTAPFCALSLSPEGRRHWTPCVCAAAWMPPGLTQTSQRPTRNSMPWHAAVSRQAACVASPGLWGLEKAKDHGTEVKKKMGLGGSCVTSELHTNGVLGLLHPNDAWDWIERPELHFTRKSLAFGSSQVPKRRIRRPLRAEASWKRAQSRDPKKQT